MTEKLDKAQIRRGEISNFLLGQNQEDWVWLIELLRWQNHQCQTCDMRGWIWWYNPVGADRVKQACPDCVGKNE